ncbi:SOS response-associated peptidase family protein [Luteimonas sp. MC1750]|uniref:SOS response-associated peptidase family protein n=1 Tax=Luteimonas sp. MC1750 TaxID=2799326 RepID=UPI0018F0E37D|nr:SOS response-associated peptidase family protein [Luteimonas sp. MC1750]MBJ6983972.1 SOS response-associated peptidase family protein [Luteimonas sp. MC1750]QQO06785.1 SOS response-associated peptidase family protein [Luteimonas sp. MC1750]
MCYSAEAWTLYDSYVATFGADIDIKAFWELYLGRDEAYRVRQKLSDGTKIPKGMDLNFLRPKTELERNIQDLIGEWNGRKLAESEAELAKQQARLEAAEAKLATKPTKTAANEQRIATNKIAQMERWIADAKRTSHKPAQDDRIFPFWYAPVLLVEDGKPIIRPMRYLCRPQGMAASTDYTKDGKASGKYNARRDNLTKFWRRQFGSTHALMLAETFYENVDNGRGGSKEIQFRPRTGETMYIACLYSHWTDPKGEEPDLWSFAAITDEPEAEVAAAGHDRTIINIKPEHAMAWLTPEGRTDEELFAIFDDKRHPYYEVIKQAA